MKKTVSRLGSAALCVTLSLALGCGCAVMPPASSEKPASSAVSVPTDAEGKPLYDATRLDDGRLRILYGYDNSGDSRTVLCGSKVLYQSLRSENVSLLPALFNTVIMTLLSLLLAVPLGVAAAAPCTTRTAAK